MSDGSTEEVHATPPIKPSSLGAWWRQGARTAFLRRADWAALRPSPGTLAWLTIFALAGQILVYRLFIAGPALFLWRDFRVGWLGTVLVIWICWLLVPQPRDESDREPSSASALFAMFVAQGTVFIVFSGLLYVPMTRVAFFSESTMGSWIRWGAWIAVTLWYLVSQFVLVWRIGTARAGRRAAAILLIVATTGIELWLHPPEYWRATAPQIAQADRDAPVKLTQELLELQPRLLQTKLAAIEAGRPGIVNVYAITFAPYSNDDVFQRESDLVASVMQDRFGSAGKTLQLVNSRKTLRNWPWATPLNLQRSIRRMAERMNRDEDILFIHLTSHGAQNGELATSFWPLDFDSVTPQMLRRWLDDAGVRFRVISVSACYSGSWIEPLSDSGTLIMTAADAAHTSFGCGNGSTFTYFGRAMFDEQLRQTWSFTKAHEAARLVIDQREREAGKSDGYSNPQIRVGDGIKETLVRLERERAERR